MTTVGWDDLAPESRSPCGPCFPDSGRRSLDAPEGPTSNPWCRTNRKTAGMSVTSANAVAESHEDLSSPLLRSWVRLSLLPLDALSSVTVGNNTSRQHTDACMHAWNGPHLFVKWAKLRTKTWVNNLGGGTENVGGKTCKFHPVPISNVSDSDGPKPLSLFNRHKFF